MAPKSRFHFWLCTGLSCVLAVTMSLSPMMLAMLVENVRVGESQVPDSSEEVEVCELTLSESKTSQRRQRRKQAEVRTTLSSNHGLRVERLASRKPGSRVAGQGSLRGRCGPLHC